MNASDFLPAEFNVATWFVDRPVAEGKGAAPAPHSRVTCGAVGCKRQAVAGRQGSL